MSACKIWNHKNLSRWLKATFYLEGTFRLLFLSFQSAIELSFAVIKYLEIHFCLDILFLVPSTGNKFTHSSSSRWYKFVFMLDSSTSMNKWCRNSHFFLSHITQLKTCMVNFPNWNLNNKLKFTKPSGKCAFLTLALACILNFSHHCHTSCP